MSYPEEQFSQVPYAQQTSGLGRTISGNQMAAINGKASFRQNLEQRLRNARSEVERTEELLQLLDRNPDMYRVLELLGHY